MTTAKHIHFIGVGGIGISALARMMALQGLKITANDLDEFPLVTALRAFGIDTKIGKDPSVIPTDADLIVYSVAWDTIAPELLEYVKTLNIPMKTYAEMLGELSKEKYTIAVSGTHGKTTTTAMIASILSAAGFDPTVIVGSLMKQPDGSYSNFVAGKSKYLVVEACEYKRSFLNLWPKVLVVTNVDNDHLDYYKDIADIQSAFRELAERVPADGAIVADAQLPDVAPAVQHAQAQLLNYADALMHDQPFDLAVPGIHNQKNAAAAFTAAKFLGVDEGVARAALKTFTGTWRRFELKGATKNGAVVYDDYGHHPAEVKATLQGARSLFPNKKIIIAFHPHLFSRTKLLFNDFVTAFDDADEVVLAPIYPAREPFDPSISSVVLADAITKHGKPARALNTFDDIYTYLNEQAIDGTIIITMGAGDIYKVAEKLVQ